MKHILKKLHIIIRATGLAVFILFFFHLPAGAQSPFKGKVLKIHKGPVNVVQFSPDGKLILSASADKTCKVYNPETGKVVFTIPFDREVHAASFSPDGRFILAGSGPYLKVYTNQGKYYKTYKGHSTAIWSLETDPSGKYVVTGSFDKTFYLWDIIAGEKKQQFKGHTKSVLSVAFSPDGRHLASGSLDKSVKVWKIGTQAAMEMKGLHGGNVVDLAFSPDGNVLASASRDGNIYLWDVKTGEKLKALNHHDEVYSVAFSPDGIWLVSGTLHGDLFLWDRLTGGKITTLQGHSAAVLSLSLHPGGKQFISGSYDKSIRLWNVEPEIFAMYSFPDSVKASLEGNPLGQPRKAGENKTSYRERILRFETFKKQQFEKYYRLYLEQRGKNIINK